MKRDFLNIVRNKYFKTLNSFVKFFLEAFIINRKIRRSLKGEFCKWYLKKYINQVEKLYVPTFPKKHTRYRIWQYWDSGFDNAPDIVKACISSVDKYKGDIERIFLTKDNIKEYVDIPQFYYEMYDKGIIKPAHFSDILRTYLLVEHGGCWIDATVYLTAPLPDYIRASELFVFQNDEEKDLDGLNMANYFISSNGNSVILQKMKKFLDIFWQENNFCINYFFYLHAFTMFSKSSEQNQLEWSEMLSLSYLSVQIMQNKLLNTYSENLYNELKRISPIHKLTYKNRVLSKKKNIDFSNTLYEHILQEYELI